MSIATPAAPTTATELSLNRLHLVRAGYLQAAPSPADVLPLYEGVTLCLLTAMSFLAHLGLRYPVKLLPLLFE